MPLAPKFEVNQQPVGYTAVFKDLTGDFSATNPGGWNGGVNPEKANVTAATLDIYFPDSTTGIPDEATSTTNQVDLFARSYPVQGEIVLTPADFLAATQIPDGAYLFKLTVTTTTTTDPPVETVHEAVYWYGGFYRIAECCADGKIKKGCNCEEKLSNTQTTVLLMRAMFYAISLNETYCQDVVKMAEALKFAQELCSSNCKNCGC